MNRIELGQQNSDEECGFTGSFLGENTVRRLRQGQKSGTALGDCIPGKADVESEQHTGNRGGVHLFMDS